MKNIHKQVRRRKQRGSALLVSLMVMVGLSLLGLGFVAISQTENTISTNERNYTQTLSVAEAGARLCLEWFQDPNWANTRGVLPANTNAIKTLRTLSSNAQYGSGYSGYYKSDNASNVPIGLLFDKPYKPAARHRFLGDENHPDVLINDTNAAAFLTTFNNNIAADDSDGRVTEIRVFSPPIVGGVLNANGFYDSGTRYGLCTIRVTAQKIINGTVVAQRTVKTVISEWPFPGPQGPVQSNANISTGGNFGVHWGKMTSELDMDIKSPWVGLPWFDAWERIHFEHGWYTPGQTSNDTPNDSSICDGADWLYQLTGRGFEDPWFEARAKGAISNTVAGANPQPFKVASTANDILNTPNVGWSNWFQNQDLDNNPGICGGRDKKLVVFPKIDYEFWKNLSRSSTSTNASVHYLSWVSGENYTDGISIANVAHWVNTARATNPSKPGFYFFDTQNGLNPQGTAAPGILAPDVTINSSDDGNTFKMAGFIYLNAATYGTQGIGGPDAYFNFPGEPYRDIGYRRVCDSAGNSAAPGGPTPWAFCTTGTLIVGASDGEFSGQDLNGNGVYDVYINPVAQTRTRPDGSGTFTSYFPVEWFPGCTPGTNGVAGANCSEPQEPFLNLIYPSTAATSSGGPPTAVVVGWENPTSVTKRSKVKDSSGNPVACAAGLVAATAPLTGPDHVDINCTSNAYDRDGSLVQNFRPNGNNAAAILDGVLYNEGAFNSSGNGAYFGSVLINGNIQGTGTAEVWFDELLIKGGWQDKFKDLPRVFVTAHETDQ